MFVRESSCEFGWKLFYGKLDNAYYFFEMELQTVEIVKNNYHTSQEKWLNKFGIQNTTTCYTQKLKVFIYLFWKVYNYEICFTWIWNALKYHKTISSNCFVIDCSIYLIRCHFLFLAPVLTVMDGFGRKLLDQFYKVGSSLEVMCHVDRLPKRPLPEIIEWRHGDKILSKSNATLGQR